MTENRSELMEVKVAGAKEVKIHLMSYNDSYIPVLEKKRNVPQVDKYSLLKDEALKSGFS